MLNLAISLKEQIGSVENQTTNVLEESLVESTNDGIESTKLNSISHIEPTTESEPTKKLLNLFGVDYQVADVFKDLTMIEELKTFLPEMIKVLYDQLKANIRKNGVIDPILYYTLEDGTKLVIEGHTRLRAAIMTRKKEVPTKEIHEKFQSIDDIKFWMVKQQFQRRNLSNVEKLKLAYLSKDVIVQQAKQNLKKGGAGKTVEKPIDTDNEIAKIAGISKSTVSRYTKVMKYGAESLIQKMQNGEISIKQAAIKAKKPEDSNETVNKEGTIVKHEPNEPKIVDLQVGQYMLSRAEVEALVIIKDKNDIKMFNNSQLARIGFVILN